MNDSPFETVYNRITGKLDTLGDDLTYHCKRHTLDVLEQCERIGALEGVKDPHQLYLLKTAALYHDAGFLESYADHENHSCNIFLRDAEAYYNFTDEDKKIITGLIDATRLPQKPLTLLEKIICDADLDYLGRADFPETSDGLRREFLYHKVVSSNEQWNSLQMNFLLNHQYFTASSQKLREPVKQKNIEALY